MRKPQYRTRDFSNPNYKRQKQSAQNFYPKAVNNDRSRNGYREPRNEEIQRVLSAPIKPPFSIHDFTQTLAHPVGVCTILTIISS